MDDGAARDRSGSFGTAQASRSGSAAYRQVGVARRDVWRGYFEFEGTSTAHADTSVAQRRREGDVRRTAFRAVHGFCGHDAKFYSKIICMQTIIAAPADELRSDIV